MEMAYRDRWEAEIAEMRRVLAGLAMEEECKWGQPTYTFDGKNIVILQGFKEYFGLGFFQGAPGEKLRGTPDVPEHGVEHRLKLLTVADRRLAGPLSPQSARP